MPVKFGLKFMPIIGSNGVNSKRKFFDYIIYKIDGIYLSMPFIDL